MRTPARRVLSSVVMPTSVVSCLCSRKCTSALRYDRSHVLSRSAREVTVGAAKFEDQVVISGIGQSDIGRALDRSPLALTLDAITAALDDAGLAPQDVSALTTYPRGGTNLGPGFAGPSLAEVYGALGLEVDRLLGNFEGPAQLGPVLTASLAINAGLARHVVLYRTVTEGSARRNAGEATAPDWFRRWITPFGGGPAPIGFALLARRHFHEFGTTREQLAQIALTARRHAQTNPNAIFGEPMTMDDYLSSRMITDPLCLYDCDVHCDGATAIVLSDAAYADDSPSPAVRIDAIGTAPPPRSEYAQHVDLQPGRRAAAQM